jgi:hypothetical protein
MPFFSFGVTDPQHDADYVGSVVGVDNRRISLDVADDQLDRVSVGRLAVFPVARRDQWLVGVIDRVVCGAQALSAPADANGLKGNSGAVDPLARATQANMASITLVGSVKDQPGPDGTTVHVFTRSLLSVPDVRTPGFALRDRSLNTFMRLLVKASETEHALVLGHYSLDPSATAYLDGDKFFQRHAALLGSTGAGKSWAVATIIERAAKLPSSSLVVFDLHGEYTRLGYARQLRIPGPDDLLDPRPDLLFLPYWLMNAEELAATFVDGSESTAHDQVLVLQREVEQSKRAFLQQLGKTDVLDVFTVDSPVPFPLESVLTRLEEMNTKMHQDYRGAKQGEFFGMFGRLLVRLRTKRADRRYGFMFQAPESMQTYDAFSLLARQLLDFTSPRAQVRIIDFSEVPADVLPIMLGIVARMIYYLQFWMPKEMRHPVALVCDEAHLYLPRECANENEMRARACFQKIAKEGRKYGVSLVVVSQRPSDVDATILSQCNNVLALRLTNTNDQAVVQRLMPDGLGSLLEALPILDTGETLAVGDAVLLPSRIRIQPPVEKPVSATIDFWTEWNKVGLHPDWQLAAENMRRQRRMGTLSDEPAASSVNASAPAVSLYAASAAPAAPAATPATPRVTGLWRAGPKT